MSFFEYDEHFDGLYGLWNGIYYIVKEIQDFFIDRFKNVRYFITPDYSKCGDSLEVENEHRQLRSRIVSIWLTMNTNAVVIPLVSCANKYSKKYMLDGMEDCVTVAFNAKGPLKDPRQLVIFKDAIKYTVDRLSKLKCIIVYSASPNKKKIYEIFKYAIDKGIRIQIPENTLQIRNKLKGCDNYDCDK